MLQAKTITFLRGLEQNNNRDWFEANREAYLAAKTDFEGFTEELKTAMTPLVPALEGQQAKSLIFRIFRDVRFSKDKTPYKSHFSAYFSEGGRKWAGAGYYLHIQPGGGSFAAAGIWMPEPALLKKIRQEIDYGLDEFNGILRDKAFKKHFGGVSGETLQKVPAGYDAANPAADYLKMKSFIADTKISDEQLQKKDLIRSVQTAFAAAAPLVSFLNRAME